VGLRPLLDDGAAAAAADAAAADAANADAAWEGAAVRVCAAFLEGMANADGARLLPLLLLLLLLQEMCVCEEAVGL